MTSNRVGNCIALSRKIDRKQSNFKAIPRRETVFHVELPARKRRLRSMRGPEVEQAHGGWAVHVKRPWFSHPSTGITQPVKPPGHSLLTWAPPDIRARLRPAPRR